MNLLLAGDLAPDDREAWLALLRQRLPHDRIETSHAALAVDDVDVAIVANPPPGALAGARRLQLIQSLWAGVDRLLRDATLPAGVPLARMVDPAMTAAMAETAHWAVLSLHRGYYAYAQQQRQRLWAQRPQCRAGEQSVLVLGYGEMGRATATRLAAAGYRVAAWRQGRPGASATSRADTPDARQPGDAAGAITVTEGPAALSPQLALADIIVNLLPLTGATQGLVDRAFLARLKPGAALVNLARGAHVVEADLLAALDQGHLGHAVLDVFQIEPLPIDHPFWAHPQVTLLPHAAALTDRRSAADLVVRNVEAVRAGQPLAHLVDRTRGY